MWDDVRAHVPDLYLSLLLTPAAARPALLALYALEAELLTIPNRVTQPTIGLMRVTWWRDRLAERDTAQPLLKALATEWPDDAATLAEFAESFGVLFEDITADEGRRILQARAMLWATLVAKHLAAPLPESYAAAQAHYGLAEQAASMPQSKPLKLIVRLAYRRTANRNNWLGHAFTALRTAVY